MNSLHASAAPVRTDRLQQIEAARRTILAGGHGLADPQGGVDGWIERSWRRCLSHGQRPGDAVAFDAISREAIRRAVDSSRSLITAARPVLGQLAHAMAHTRYFAILTNAQGIVVDVNGPIDRTDRRVSAITRVGVDLSENAVGTTAIGAALGEQHAVWLHRGEHFFADNSMYSCAGAPVFGPTGQCVGMLDLTGVEVTERPELKHLVTLSAQRIENALLHQQTFSLLVRLRWPSDGLLGNQNVSPNARFYASESDGMICLDPDGYVMGSNTVARHMLPALIHLSQERMHCSDLFAMPWENLFDADLLDGAGLEVPLWSGLRLQALPLSSQEMNRPLTASAAQRGATASLRDVETALIRKAVDQARGNVAQAARALGISRATVYRRLGTPVATKT